MKKFKISIWNCIVTFDIEAIDEADADKKANEKVNGINDIDINGYDIEVVPLAYCDYCGDEFEEDNLTLMANASLVCEDCYEQAQAELNGE